MAQTGFPSISANAIVYPIVVNSSTTIVCGINGMKDSWILRNAGNCLVYIKYGDNCNPVIYTHSLKPNAIFADNYGGLITSCVDANNSGLLLVTLKI